MTTNDVNAAPTTEYLNRPEGRVAYDVTGRGPLVVLVPGMGDLRATYRLLAPHLIAAGYRVAATDLRGHGDSDTTFGSYGDAETASDVIALIEELGVPAVVVGNSMGAGAAAHAASVRPDLIAGLVLVGPFVRNGEINAFTRFMMRIAMATPWAATSWKSYLPRLYAGYKPTDLDAHLRRVITSVRRPGYARAFSLTTRADHAPTEARLGQIHTPTLVVMGELDPDFPDPRAEADWIAAALKGEVVMIADAGHYPQSQQPVVVSEAILGFLSRAGLRG
jgi:pimeloyl-ACP methyl ester carboxylesterase